MMFDVEGIIQKNHPYFPIYRYRFPTIDFKFQNTGNATAFLWQFSIKILEADIDPTPVLDFEVQVESGKLQIVASNNGWGTAFNCHISVEEATLNQLFAPSNRTFKGNIPDGEQQVIFSFSKKKANPEQFEAVSKNFTRIFHNHPQAIKGKNIELLLIKWICTDKRGIEYKGEERLQAFDDNGEFILTPEGFFKTINGRAKGRAMSNLTYGVIIDLSKGMHEKSYPISRQIPPGGIERFHIMVGALLSCHLLVQFKLFFDSSTDIETKLFDIEIWNPRNSHWHYGYKDGEELQRDIEEQEKLLNSAQRDDEYKRRVQSHLEYLQRLASDYPFIPHGFSSKEK